MLQRGQRDEEVSQEGKSRGRFLFESEQDFPSHIQLTADAGAVGGESPRLPLTRSPARGQPLRSECAGDGDEPERHVWLGVTADGPGSTSLLGLFGVGLRMNQAPQGNPHSLLLALNLRPSGIHQVTNVPWAVLMKSTFGNICVDQGFKPASSAKVHVTLDRHEVSTRP